jgi:DNA-binding NtrC family response regulator
MTMTNSSGERDQKRSHSRQVVVPTQGAPSMWRAHLRPEDSAPLVGSSPAMRALRARIERVAATDFTILIEGGSSPEVETEFRL